MSGVSGKHMDEVGCTSWQQRANAFTEARFLVLYVDQVINVFIAHLNKSRVTVASNDPYSYLHLIRRVLLCLGRLKVHIYTINRYFANSKDA